MNSNPYSEDALCEQPAIELFSELGWETLGCFDEFAGGASTLGRGSKGEVVLVGRLAEALRRLNPEVPEEAIGLAVEKLARDRSSMSSAAANQDVYMLLKGGVKVTYRGGEDGAEEIEETLRVIDWKEPGNNDFLLASQLWITGEMYLRRTDLIGFVNGLPLLFIELKASHKSLKKAYDDNLQDYRSAIPQLFWYNSIVILSNGSTSVVGSSTADWEHFADWKRISSEGEAGIVSLETVILGVAEQSRLLDLAENFTLFMESRGGLKKVVARNHQYLGVNKAIEKLKEVMAEKGMEAIDGHGKLGVFWHTQGSGKSISMIFFAQKILRRVPGHWTFLIVTDRDDLDDQIYKNFVDAGAITGTEAQAVSGEHLKELLAEDHRYIFTLIQKFQSRDGTPYPKVTDRSNIIVIADEAHRSQYETLAMNMRKALPNAAFIAFTGTPLMAGEEKTREVFGEYVSIYDFKQSTSDGATVPLYYENRVPELQLTNDRLNERMEEVLEAAELDERQEEKLAREFSREYHLITRDDRLERVAKDLVEHFMGRGFHGKAMVVSIDKATAVRMYDKVRRYWNAYMERLRADLPDLPERDAERRRARIAYMESTDMAVVVSQGQNEVEEMKKKGVDIVPHRKRMVEQDLEEKFKDPNDPFRIVFVCAMWITGFDVPSCSTIYLDKPMRNHTLMQTIARANRVFPEKVNGLIVDYVGVFRNLQKALAIYGSRQGGGADDGEMPVLPKEELIELLREAVAEAVAFCTERGIDIDAIPQAIGFKRLALVDAAYEAIATDDESKVRFRLLHAQAVRFYKAILPDTRASEFAAAVRTIDVLAEKIRNNTPPADIDGVMAGIEEVLDESVSVEPYVIREGHRNRVIDLSEIDFTALQKQFENGRQRATVDQLRAMIEQRLTRMVETNKTRIDFLERFQRMIDDYNSASVNVEEFFDRLKEFAASLSTEEQRTISEGLNEEELAIFDLLTRPEGELTKKERGQVQKAARHLLDVLKREKLVLDWRKRSQTRAQVLVAIEEILDADLPSSFSAEKYRQKCQLIYQHIYDSYYGNGRSSFDRIS